MKFTQEKKVVTNALKNASACIDSKPMIPIIGNALIEADAETGIVSVTCTAHYGKF